ncbi:hypothetical protein IAG41_00505 [Sphingomonas sp. JC676]|uniref:hypothetical protein n=1 Tax=Sphingomonas sp. JC676 TaxID=2768065 RepID=UPI00165835A2|nr:hypothetical protein [Sphingomonas sp. JC676]MBC9030861.1 hypothetical protein [Sphingomonas sp. JC676]
MDTAIVENDPAREMASREGYVSAHFSPLGVTLQVTASNAQLIHAVADACLGWEAPTDPGGPMLRLSLKVGPVSVSGTGPVVRTDGPRLLIQGDADVDAGADAEHGYAWCRVANADAFRDPDFREQVLDGLILWLVTRSGRTPLHASAFVVGSTAMLLAGRSGSGKSCLALAAYSAGYPLLSDDTVYIEMQRRFRVWGIPRPVHVFPEDASEHAAGPIRLRNGKRKRAIALTAPPKPVTADAAILLMLQRGDHLSLDALEPSEAAVALGPLEPGFDLLAEDVMLALHRLTRHGAWRLNLGLDPAEAIRFLTANLPMLASRAVS